MENEKIENEFLEVDNKNAFKIAIFGGIVLTLVFGIYFANILYNDHLALRELARQTAPIPSKDSEGKDINISARDAILNVSNYTNITYNYLNEAVKKGYLPPMGKDGTLPDKTSK